MGYPTKLGENKTVIICKLCSKTVWVFCLSLCFAVKSAIKCQKVWWVSSQEYHTKGSDRLVTALNPTLLIIKDL